MKVGDRVAWTSQSAGRSKAKRGTVVEIVLPGERPNIKGVGWGRDHVSYLVREDSGRLYWPRVAHLKSDETGAAEEQCRKDRDDAIRLLAMVVTGGNPTGPEWQRINELIREVSR